MYISVLRISDPPPAEAVLLTESVVEQRIEEFLSEEKYTEILKLVVEEKDKDKLREAEQRRKDRDYVLPTLSEEKVPGTKPKRGKKSKL